MEVTCPKCKGSGAVVKGGVEYQCGTCEGRRTVTVPDKEN